MLQGDMHQVCQLAGNGIPAVGPEAWEGVESRRVGRIGRLAAADPQVDSSEDETSMVWGDLGRVYFWIRGDDLAQRRWDRVWLVMQCG